MKFCEDMIDRLTNYDIPSWLAGARSFKAKLFDLISSADSVNLKILRQAYPNEVEAYHRWFS